MRAAGEKHVVIAEVMGITVEKVKHICRGAGLVTKHGGHPNRRFSIR